MTFDEHDPVKSGCYDTQGRPISLRVWSYLFEDRSRDDERWWRVGRDELDGGVVVSTVWMGIDHAFSFGPPLIFETMIFDDGSLWTELLDQMAIDCWRYATWREAEAGHARVLDELRTRHAARTTGGSL